MSANRRPFIVHFHGGRIGDVRHVKPLITEAYDATELATKAYRFALRRLPGAIIEVELDPDVKFGRITNGWETLATFEAVEGVPHMEAVKFS